jgi:hypothetical protein
MNCMVNSCSFTGAIAEVSIGRPDYTLTAVGATTKVYAVSSSLLRSELWSPSPRLNQYAVSTYCTY